MHRQFRSAASLLLVGMLLGAAPAAEPSLPPAIRVLLLSGQNNHDWKTTTPKIESTGRFQVRVEEHPEQLTADSLQACDVILSNWNSWGQAQKGAPAEWPEPLRQAYVDFVRGGKGHVVVHAGSSSFADWKDYQAVTLAWWQLGQTGHGPVHEFPVRIEAVDHPVTRGLKNFTTRDELWNRPGIQPGAIVLASSWSAAESKGTGAWEPTALAAQVGKGRSFTLLLGHDAAAMENAGYGQLLLRGTEWAATGEVR
ncbi:MAG: ThuA domain-containing protein [Thermoguttaceae bacterium]